MRSGWEADASQVVIDAGYLGMGPKGFGSHGHADTLSFTFFAQGRPQLVDPGTYVYTGVLAWRDAFRSTRFHNGLTVNGYDVCGFDDGPFRWSSLCNPTVEIWQEGKSWVVFRGRHDGFSRVARDLIHVRTIALHRVQPVLVVLDEVRGKGSNSVDRWFQFGPGSRIEVCPVTCGRWCGPSSAGALGLFVPGIGGERIEVYAGDEVGRLGWHSSRYGKKEPATTVRVAAEDRSLPYAGIGVIMSRDLDVGPLLETLGAEIPEPAVHAMSAWKRPEATRGDA
jgi:hypothetical protein